MAQHLHRGDLPPGLTFGDSVAIDTETMGLDPHRDRLCLVQLSRGDGDCHLVQFPPGEAVSASNLAALLTDGAVLKIFHFARFDLAVLEHGLGVRCGPVYCTKIASRLARTFTDRHGLKDLCRDLLGVEMSKQQQSSDWGADRLSRKPARLCRERRAPPASAEGKTRRDARARGARGTGRGLLRLPARPRPARPRGLARGGHFRPRLARMSHHHPKVRQTARSLRRRTHFGTTNRHI